MIPTGMVQTPPGKEGWVFIESSEYCDEAREYSVYDIHPRFRDLRSDCIASRLHLASIYACCGSQLPEARTGMTGHETAIAIVRHQWVNRPLSKEEANALQNIAQNCHGAPALSILCHDLHTSSQYLNFLYPHATRMKVASLDIGMHI